MQKKESRVLLTDDQHAALSYAAEKMGMKLATYLRHCALTDAAARGINFTQPKPS